MKIWKWIVLGFVALIVIAVLIVYFSLNGIVRSTVQKQTTSSLNLDTSVGGANVSLVGTSLGLDDIQIASPQGFSAPRMFTLDGVKVDVSIGQLRQDPIHVASIDIKKPMLVIEQSGGKFNIQALMGQESKAPPDNKEPIKLIIDELKVSDAKVVLRPGIPGVAQEIPVSIPTLEMKGVGSGEGNQNGAAIKEVVMDVVTALSAKASESDQLPPEVRQLLKLNVGELTAQLRGQAAEQISKITGDLSKKLPGDLGKTIEQIGKNPDVTKDPGKAVEEGLGGLLKGKSDTTKPTTKKAKKK
ncbi:MAG TPA: AsmA family protein [Tepidisphaeraceae bacterium]|nr:AsmA family protein [Tepidisphaeraceae bacterium]